MPNLWRGETDDEIRAALEVRYPSLRLARPENRRVIMGAFNVQHTGHFLGGFQVEVLLDVPDELGLPTVREVGGRIPRMPERHINDKFGTACLYLPEDLAVRVREPLGIIEFLDGPVRNFFLGQIGAEMGTPFPLGEWGHGADGVKEMLTQLLGSDDVGTCVAFLELLSRKVIKAHWPCPCGSGRSLRDCHDGVVRRVRQRLPLTTRRFLLERARKHFPEGQTTRNRP
ncbi:MAG: SEC-C domain-containing protein [Polyangiaceae bacterium]|nr:SEC-C domain-containing protein [Polyangiaceae bacterium]